MEDEARNFSNKIIIGICSAVGLVMIFVGSLIFPDMIVSTRICVIFVVIGAIMFFAGIIKLIVMSAGVSRNEDFPSSPDNQSLVKPGEPEQISVAIYPPLPYVVGLYQNPKI